MEMWLEYILRFAHLVAGIAWIGSSFYFIWLDSSFLPPESPRRNVDGELYMVHGGHYYQVEKRKIYPGELPKILHWFKWEATLTWVTGIVLFAVMYYGRSASLLIDQSVMQLSQGEAIGISLGIIVGAWVIYDLIWNPKIQLPNIVSNFLSLLFFAGLVYLNTSIFSGRGAFIQTGAVLGTLMLANVWMRILPGQKKMLADAEAGRVPDYSLGLKSKVRSVHNTYFIFPVLFIMLSNHYPAIYAHPKNWLLLIILSVSGALVRHVMVSDRTIDRWLLLPATIGVGTLVFLTQPQQSQNPITSAAAVTYEEVATIFQKHCLSCHSSQPTDEVFTVAPKGVIFETEAQIRAAADKIYIQTVASKIMPLGNKSQMTDAERELLGRWLGR